MNTADEREIKRKLKALLHAEQSGNTAKTCWYFGVSRSTFYRWLMSRNAEETSGLTIPEKGHEAVWQAL